jgi:pimeloyl-ACP methyl ester carboxylesterase
MPILLRLLLALLATLSIPLILGTPAHAVEAAGPIESFPRFTIETIGNRGPDVFLIPGLATPREVFRPLAEALKGDARLHLVELRGFGPGDPGPNAQGGVIAGLADGLTDYISAHKLTHVKLIGHSLGGFTALELALRKPTGIDRVMIVDALPFAGMIYGGAAASVDMIRPQADAIRDQLLGLARSGGTMPPAVQLALSPEGKAKITSWTKDVDLRAVAWAMYEDLVSDARPALPGLKVPVTVLVPLAGKTAERNFTRSLYTAAYAPAPGATLVWLLDSGHFAMLDQPAAFETAVRAFLLPAG